MTSTSTGEGSGSGAELEAALDSAGEAVGVPATVLADDDKAELLDSALGDAVEDCPVGVADAGAVVAATEVAVADEGLGESVGSAFLVTRVQPTARAAARATVKSRVEDAMTGRLLAGPARRATSPADTVGSLHD